MNDLSGSLPKALVLLDFMSRRQKDVSFKELKDHSGFAANVLSRLLKTFIEYGYFAKSAESGLYSLGAGAFTFSELVLGRRSRKDLVQGVLDGLAAGVKESAAYFDYDGDWVTLLAKSEVANSYHYLDVMSRDVHSPMNGFFFCCLPFLVDSKAQKILSKRDDRFGYSRERITELFFKIRSEKVHVSKEFFHRSEITRVCAPVFIHGGQQLAGAIGVTVNTHNLQVGDLEMLVKTVKESALMASGVL
jgi:DNA-binding IclR family transcriptional regulator